jgi:hypothetical protein
VEEQLELEGIAKQADAMLEKHGNVEETRAAIVCTCDVTQQVASDECGSAISATHHGNVTHLAMPNLLTGVSQVAANTNLRFRLNYIRDCLIPLLLS